jgi:hypothetical protein
MRALAHAQLLEVVEAAGDGHAQRVRAEHQLAQRLSGSTRGLVRRGIRDLFAHDALRRGSQKFARE